VGLYDVNSPSNLLSGALEKSKVLFKYKLVNVLSAKYTCSNDKELVTPAEEAKNNISTGSATLDLGSLVPGSEGLNCSVDYVDLGNVSKKCPATTNIVSIYACDPKATPLPTQSCTAANATSAVRTCVNAGPATGTWSVDCIPTVCAADSSLNATKTACEKNSCQGLIADKHAEPCAGFNTKVKTADIKTTLVNNCNLANSCEYQCSNGYYLIANTGLCEESVCNLKWADTKAEIKVLVGNSKVAYKNRFVKDYSECDTFKETRTCKFDGKVMSLDGQNVNSTCEACANGKVPNADGSQCVEAPVNGACGIAKTSGKEYPTAPNVASELCDKGTASAVTGGASGGVNTGWSWTCKGSTTDGGQGTTETCSAKFKYNKVCKDATRFIEKGFQTCSIDVNSTESCSSCGVDQIYCLASSQCDTVCTTGNYFNATQAICESTTCVSSWSDNGSKFTLENGKSQLIYSKKYVSSKAECSDLSKNLTCKNSVLSEGFPGNVQFANCDICADSNSIPNSDGTECVPKPQDGLCGSAMTSGKDYAAAPVSSSELCASGKASIVEGGSSKGINSVWTWTCEGTSTQAGKGKIASCSAKVRYDKECADATNNIVKGVQVCTKDLAGVETCSSTGCSVDKGICVDSTDSVCNSFQCSKDYFVSTDTKQCKPAYCSISWLDAGSGVLDSKVLNLQTQKAYFKKYVKNVSECDVATLTCKEGTLLPQDKAQDHRFSTCGTCEVAGTIPSADGSTCAEDVSKIIIARCGSASTGSFNIAPSANLCETGKASLFVSGGLTTRWNWTCTGSSSSGADTAPINCFADYTYDKKVSDKINHIDSCTKHCTIGASGEQCSACVIDSCEVGYRPDASFSTCVENSCIGTLIKNAEFCPNDNQAIPIDGLDVSIVGSCTNDKKCEMQCSKGYIYNPSQNPAPCVEAVCTGQFKDGSNFKISSGSTYNLYTRKTALTLADCNAAIKVLSCQTPPDAKGSTDPNLKVSDGYPSCEVCSNGKVPSVDGLTCVDAATDGACGLAMTSGTEFIAAPAAKDLCASGTATAVTGGGTSPWSWSCTGTTTAAGTGKSSPVCSAKVKYDKACSDASKNIAQGVKACVNGGTEICATSCSVDSSTCVDSTDAVCKALKCSADYYLNTSKGTCEVSSCNVSWSDSSTTKVPSKFSTGTSGQKAFEKRFVANVADCKSESLSCTNGELKGTISDVITNFNNSQFRASDCSACAVAGTIPSADGSTCATDITRIITAKCGADDGGKFTAAPNANLCSTGKASPATKDETKPQYQQYWSWTCTGTSAAGTDDTPIVCKASYQYDKTNNPNDPVTHVVSCTQTCVVSPTTGESCGVCNVNTCEVGFTPSGTSCSENICYGTLATNTEYCPNDNKAVPKTGTAMNLVSTCSVGDSPKCETQCKNGFYLNTSKTPAVCEESQCKDTLKDGITISLTNSKSQNVFLKGFGINSSDCSSSATSVSCNNTQFTMASPNQNVSVKDVFSKCDVCAGATIPSVDGKSCAAKPEDGVCGKASTSGNKYTSTPPVADLCSDLKAASTVSGGTAGDLNNPWTWTCAGTTTAAGKGNTTTCTAPVEYTVSCENPTEHIKTGTKVCSRTVAGGPENCTTCDIKFCDDQTYEIVTVPLGTNLVATAKKCIPHPECSIVITDVKDSITPILGAAEGTDLFGTFKKLTNVNSALYLCTGQKGDKLSIGDLTRPNIYSGLKMTAEDYSCGVVYTNKADQLIQNSCNSNIVKKYDCNPGMINPKGCPVNTAKTCDKTGKWATSCTISCTAPTYQLNVSKSICECVNGGTLASNCASCPSGKYLASSGNCEDAPAVNCDIGLYDKEGNKQLGAVESGSVTFKYDLENVLSAKYTCTDPAKSTGATKAPVDGTSSGSVNLTMGKSALTCSVEYIDLGNAAKKCPSSTNSVALFDCDPTADPAKTKSCVGKNAAASVVTCQTSGANIGKWGTDCVPTGCDQYSTMNADKTACTINKCDDKITDPNAVKCSGFNKNVKVENIEATIVDNGKCDSSNGCQYQCNANYHFNPESGKCETTSCSLTWSDIPQKAGINPITILNGKSVSKVYKTRYVKTSAECSNKDNFENRLCTSGVLDGSYTNKTCSVCSDKSKVPNSQDGSTCVAAPVNGKCGTAKDQKYAIKPTTNLCSPSNEVTVSGGPDEGNKPWTWTCEGTTTEGGVGTSANCSAVYEYSATCVDPVNENAIGSKKCSQDAKGVETCSACVISSCSDENQILADVTLKGVKTKACVDKPICKLNFTDSASSTTPLEGTSTGKKVYPNLVLKNVASSSYACEGKPVAKIGNITNPTIPVITMKAKDITCDVNYTNLAGVAESKACTATVKFYQCTPKETSTMGCPVQKSGVVSQKVCKDDGTWGVCDSSCTAPSVLNSTKTSCECPNNATVASGCTKCDSYSVLNDVTQMCVPNECPKNIPDTNSEKCPSFNAKVTLPIPTSNAIVNYNECDASKSCQYQCGKGFYLSAKGKCEELVCPLILADTSKELLVTTDPSQKVYAARWVQDSAECKSETRTCNYDTKSKSLKLTGSFMNSTCEPCAGGLFPNSKGSGCEPSIVYTKDCTDPKVPNGKGIKNCQKNSKGVELCDATCSITSCDPKYLLVDVVNGSTATVTTSNAAILSKKCILPPTCSLILADSATATKASDGIVKAAKVYAQLKLANVKSASYQCSSSGISSPIASVTKPVIPAMIMGDKDISCDVKYTNAEGQAVAEECSATVKSFECKAGTKDTASCPKVTDGTNTKVCESTGANIGKWGECKPECPTAGTTLNSNSTACTCADGTTLSSKCKTCPLGFFMSGGKCVEAPKVECAISLVDKNNPSVPLTGALENAKVLFNYKVTNVAQIKYTCTDKAKSTKTLTPTADNLISDSVELTMSKAAFSCKVEYKDLSGDNKFKACTPAETNVVNYNTCDPTSEPIVCKLTNAKTAGQKCTVVNGKAALDVCAPIECNPYYSVSADKKSCELNSCREKPLNAVLCDANGEKQLDSTSVKAKLVETCSVPAGKCEYKCDSSKSFAFDNGACKAASTCEITLAATGATPTSPGTITGKEIKATLKLATMNAAGISYKCTGATVDKALKLTDKAVTGLKMGAEEFSCKVSYTDLNGEAKSCDSNKIPYYECLPGSKDAKSCPKVAGASSAEKTCKADGKWGECLPSCPAPSAFDSVAQACTCSDGTTVASKCTKCETGFYIASSGKCEKAPGTSCEMGLYSATDKTTKPEGLVTKSSVLMIYKLSGVKSATYKCTGQTKALAIDMSTAKDNAVEGEVAQTMGAVAMSCQLDYIDLLGNKGLCPASNKVEPYACDPKAVPKSCILANAKMATQECTVTAKIAKIGICKPVECEANSILNATKTACVKNECQDKTPDNAIACNPKLDGMLITNTIHKTLVETCSVSNSCEFKCDTSKSKYIPGVAGGPGRCELTTQNSRGRHCDIGGPWGWRAYNCPAGFEIEDTKKPGVSCPSGTNPSSSGCYISFNNKYPWADYCSSGERDAADECCFYMCKAQPPAYEKPCTDAKNKNATGTQTCQSDSTGKNEVCEKTCKITACKAPYVLEEQTVAGVKSKVCIQPATCEIFLSDKAAAKASSAGLEAGTKIVTTIKLANVSAAKYSCNGSVPKALTVSNPAITGLVMGTSEMKCDITYQNNAGNDGETPCSTTVKVFGCTPQEVSPAVECPATSGGAAQVKTCQADGKWGECAPSCGAAQTYDAALKACVCANDAVDAKCTKCDTFAAFDKSKPAMCVDNQCPTTVPDVNASKCANYNKDVKAGTKNTVVNANSCNPANSCEYSCNEGFFLNAKGVCEKAECSFTFADTKAPASVKMGETSPVVYKYRYVKNAGDCKSAAQSELRTCNYDAVKKTLSLTGSMLNSTCEACTGGKVPTIDGSSCETLTSSTKPCTDKAVPNGKGTLNCVTDAKNKTTCETKCNIDSCDPGYSIQDVVTNGVTAKKCVAAPTCSVFLSDVKGATVNSAGLTAGTAIISNITLKNVSSASYQCTGGTSTALVVKTPSISKLVMGNTDMKCDITYKDDANKDVSTPCTASIKLLACKAGVVSDASVCPKTADGAAQFKTCQADGNWGTCAPFVCANGAVDPKCTKCDTYAAFDKSKPAKCVLNQCPAAPATFKNASACEGFNKNVKAGTKTTLVNAGSCNATNSCEYSCDKDYFLNAKGVCEKAECTFSYADTKAPVVIKMGESSTKVYKTHYVKNTADCLTAGQFETRSCTYDAVKKTVNLSGTMLNSTCEACTGGKIPSLDGSTCETMTSSTKPCTDKAVPNGKGTLNCVTDAKNKTTCETKCNIDSCDPGYSIQDVVTNGVTAKKCVAAATCSLILSDVKGAKTNATGLTTGTVINSTITLKNVAAASYICTGGVETALSVKAPAIAKLVMGTSDMKCDITYKDDANKLGTTPCTASIKLMACKAGSVSLPSECPKTIGGADQVKTCQVDSTWGVCAPSCGAAQTYDAAKGACVCANGATDAKCTSCGTYAAFDKSKPAKCVPNVCPAVPATFTNASQCANFNQNVKTGTKMTLVSENSCNSANACEYSCNAGYILNAKGVCENSDCTLTYADTKVTESIKVGASGSNVYKLHYVKNAADCSATGQSEIRKCTYDANKKTVSLSGSMLNKSCEVCPSGQEPSADGSQCMTPKITPTTGGTDSPFNACGYEWNHYQFGSTEYSITPEAAEKICEKLYGPESHPAFYTEFLCGYNESASSFKSNYTVLTMMGLIVNLVHKPSTAADFKDIFKNNAGYTGMWVGTQLTDNFVVLNVGAYEKWTANKTKWTGKGIFVLDHVQKLSKGANFWDFKLPSDVYQGVPVYPSHMYCVKPLQNVCATGLVMDAATNKCVCANGATDAKCSTCGTNASFDKSIPKKCVPNVCPAVPTTFTNATACPGFNTNVKSTSKTTLVHQKSCNTANACEYSCNEGFFLNAKNICEVAECSMTYTDLKTSVKIKMGESLAKVYRVRYAKTDADCELAANVQKRDCSYAASTKKLALTGAYLYSTCSACPAGQKPSTDGKICTGTTTTTTTSKTWSMGNCIPADPVNSPCTSVCSGSPSKGASCSGSQASCCVYDGCFSTYQGVGAHVYSCQ
jgi:hypothetical protein